MYFDMPRRRNYVSFATAQSKGLVSVSGNQVILRADSTTNLSSTGPGRDSFYLESMNQYSNCVAMYILVLACIVLFDLSHSVALTLYICPKVVVLGQLFVSYLPSSL